MSNKIFSIRFISYKFDNTPNPELYISTNFDESQMIKNINSILEPQNLKYRGETPLSYQVNQGSLTVSGLADTYNPDSTIY